MFKVIDGFIKLKDKANKGNNSKENILENKQKKFDSKSLVEQGEIEANKQNFSKALTFFDEAIKIDPNFDCSYGDKALILDILGKFNESIVLYSKALELNPKNPITWHNKGLTYIHLKKIDEAIKCFESAISNDESYSKAWYNKGKCFEMKGNMEKAQFCLSTAKKLDPFLFTKIKLKNNKN
jgi:tetratricopeptide (TPR) repeat protein